VKSTMKASFDADGHLVGGNETTPSAGAFEATLGSLKGYIRGRVLPYLPLHQDFEWMTLAETNAADGAAFAYPPLPWIGARFKFEVREKDANKVLAKTVENKFFQRATVFIGAPDAKNYTIEADVMSEGNRRKMSEVGVINQRYAIVLKGNEQKLEINSNLERLRVTQDFKWQPNAWYHLKARVDTDADGSGTVHAKAWKKAEPEPEKWTLEVTHKTGVVDLEPDGGRSLPRHRRGGEGWGEGAIHGEEGRRRCSSSNSSSKMNPSILSLLAGITMALANPTIGFSADWPQWGGRPM